MKNAEVVECIYTRNKYEGQRKAAKLRYVCGFESRPRPKQKKDNLC